MPTRINFARMTTNTGGTSTVTLFPVTGRPSFNQALANTTGTFTDFKYTMIDQSSGAYEIGTGTYSAASPALSSRTVIESWNGTSNVSNTLINFGTTNIFVYCGIFHQDVLNTGEVSEFGLTLIDDANASVALQTLGITTDGAATVSDVNIGTSNSLAVTPDALAGSYAGTKSFVIPVFDATANVTTGDGKAYVTIPSALNGMDIFSVKARPVGAGATNDTVVQLYNVTDGVDILSVGATIPSGSNAAASGTVNTSNDSLATDDLLRVDVDAVSSTPPQGLQVIVEARLP